MKPNGGGKPTGKLATLIDKYFGSYDKFRAEFANAGMTAFGSGWYALTHTPYRLLTSSDISVCSMRYGRYRGIPYSLNATLHADSASLAINCVPFPRDFSDVIFKSLHFIM
jgi:hypothetical protein